MSNKNQNQSNSKNQSKMKNEAKRVVSLKRIKDRLEAIERTLGEVEVIKERLESKELTERQFVFNQLFMDYIRLNDITSQGKTYEEIRPNILKHYRQFEQTTWDTLKDNFHFLDEVNDYLSYHVRAKELTQTEKHEKTRQDAYDLLEGCLRAKIIGYEDITKYNQDLDKPTL